MKSTCIIVVLVSLVAFVAILVCSRKDKKEGFTPSTPSPGPSFENVDYDEYLDEGEDQVEGFSTKEKGWMPSVPTNVTPYNIDVADPASYSFSCAPRVVLKPKLLEGADMYRGDLLVKQCPEVPLVSRTTYDGSDIFAGGLFSDAHKAMYNKYTTRSLPQYVSAGETIMDM